MNSNLLYFLSGSATNSLSWAANGSYWPLTINMTNDDFTFGGAAYFMEGNVGIGFTSPSYKLDVNGTIRGYGIAQELEKIYPELVNTDDKGYKSVQYGHLAPVLIEAVKELALQNQEQQKMISDLQKEVENLKKAQKN